MWIYVWVKCRFIIMIILLIIKVCFYYFLLVIRLKYFCILFFMEVSSILLCEFVGSFFLYIVSSDDVVFLWFVWMVIIIVLFILFGILCFFVLLECNWCVRNFIFFSYIWKFCFVVGCVLCIFMCDFIKFW